MPQDEPRQEPRREASENDGRAPTRAIADVARILRRRRRRLRDPIPRPPSAR